MEGRKDIFPFDDCGTQRWADPIEVHYELAAQLDGDVNKYLRDARSQDPYTALQARKRLVEATVTAFRMERFDPATGRGATWEVCFAALREFVAWEESQKKTGGPGPTPSSAAAAPTS